MPNISICTGAMESTTGVCDAKKAEGGVHDSVQDSVQDGVAVLVLGSAPERAVCLPKVSVLKSRTYAYSV